MYIVQPTHCDDIVQFQEQRIAAKEVMAKLGMATEKEAYKDIRIDQLAVWSLLVGFFVASFNFIIIETLVPIFDNK